MGLREELWEPIWASNIAPLMRPIYLLGAEEIEEELLLVDNPMKCHKLAIEIEAAIPEIYRFWLPQRKSAVETVQRDTPKVGRQRRTALAAAAEVQDAAGPSKSCIEFNCPNHRPLPPNFADDSPTSNTTLHHSREAGIHHE